MDILKFCQQRFKHPLGRIYYGYALFVLVMVIAAVKAPILFTHVPWIFVLLSVPYLLLIPAFEVLLLIRERRLARFVKRFWILWLIGLSWSGVMYVLALQQGWVFRWSPGWLIYPALVFPFFGFWCRRMSTLGWL